MTIFINVLEIIGDASITSAALLAAIIASPYGSSQWKLGKNTKKIKQSIENTLEDIKQVALEKRKYYNVIHRLRREGLINESDEEGEKRYSLSQKGKIMLAKIKRSSFLPKPRYQKEEGDHYIIVIFDIPEKERVKRNWLREVLKNLDFNMEQKSVWIGKTRIPKELVKDLFALRLDKYVKISEITKRGSLESII